MFVQHNRCHIAKITSTKEEHSAGRKIKQKVLERESPKRSLVPTNEPVEGIQPIPPSREVEPLDRGEVEEVKSVEQGVGGHQTPGKTVLRCRSKDK